jgi:hypothetical protein
LAATLLHSLQRQEANYLAADFFYSARGGPTEISHTSMLRSILYQLLNNESHAQSLYPAFQASFRKLRSRGVGAITWAYDDLSTIIQCLASAPNVETDARVHGQKFFILLDGIDESAENPLDSPARAKVLRFLSRLCSRNSHGIFKIIALSRAERDIKGALQVAHSIDMMDVNRSDIEKVIQLGLTKVWSYMRSDCHYSPTESLESSDPEGNKDHNEKASSYEGFTSAVNLGITPLHPLAQDLLDHADGVILWVKMIIRDFIILARSGSCTLGQLHRVRSTIPKRLSDLYCDMALRIRNARYGNATLARYIMSWLLFAGRALRIDELRDVIAMFGSDQVSIELSESILQTNRPLQFETYNPTWTALTNVCGSFIEIRHSHEKPSDGINHPSIISCHDYVQLVHQTAKDFILSDTHASFLKPDLIDSHEMICVVCLNYLVMTLPLGPRFGADSNGAGTGIVMFSKIVRLLEDRPLLPYILAQLPSLLKAHDLENHTTQASSRLKAYLNSARKQPNTVTWIILGEWAERSILLGDENEDDGSVTSQKDSTSSDDAWMSNVMVAACKLGTLNAVKILLAARQNIVNAQGGLPIRSASQKGDHLIVGELLRNGANTLTWDEAKNTPLHLAISGGHILVVEMLLKADFRLLFHKNRSGIMPIELARSLGLNHISQLIRTFIPEGDVGVHQAV